MAERADIVVHAADIAETEPNGRQPTELAAHAGERERARGEAAVLAYLATLGNERSRAVVAGRLAAAARLLCDVHGIPAEPAERIPWHALRPADVDALAAALAREYAPSTANATLAAVRGVLRSAWALGYLDAEGLRRLTHGASGKPHRIKGRRPPAGRALAAGELRALAEAAAADPCRARGARDAALLALLYGGGLRRAEACALDVGDLDAEAEAVDVRRGKGAKWRRVALAAGAHEAVRAWLDECQAAGLEAGEAEPLLRAVLKGDRIAGRLTVQGVGRALARLAEEAGVQPFTAHDLRRTFAGDLLEAGADVVHVQTLMGHASPEVTARYDRRPDAARAKAARLIRYPWRARA